MFALLITYNAAHKILKYNKFSIFGICGQYEQFGMLIEILINVKYVTKCNKIIIKNVNLGIIVLYKLFRKWFFALCLIIEG